MRIGYNRIKDIIVKIESEILKIEVCLQMPGKPRELEKLKMLRISRKHSPKSLNVRQFRR